MSQPANPQASLPGTVPAAFPTDEAARIKKLLSYQILETTAESAYDDLTAIASQICDTPISLVSLVDTSRQWFKSSVGLNATETHRDLAFCAHAILNAGVMVVPDARADERFANNPLVTGKPYIRFYAGAPLITPEGHAIGTLCVIDTQPKQLSPEQVNALAALARQVVSQLEIRITLQQLQQEAEEKERTKADLQQLNENLETKVTERTQAIEQKNEQLEDALTELKCTQSHLVHSEKIAALGQLVAGVAHEINNPLGFVHGSIQHTKDYTADLIALLQLYHDTYGIEDEAIAKLYGEVDPDYIAEDLLKMLKGMQMGTHRITKIVRSLKNFSRHEQQGLHPANLHDGIDSTLLLLSSRLRQVGNHQTPINVIKNYSELPDINCDIGQLNQVFMNLLANAIEAFEEADEHGNAVEQPTITITTTALAARIQILIQDNGIGIPENVVENIFKPFFTTKPTDKGTGLGLSISHKIITQKHKGCISCQSQIGKGTTFSITIPNNLQPSNLQPNNQQPNNQQIV